MHKLLRFGSDIRYDQANNSQMCDEVESEEYTAERRKLRFFGIKSHLNKFYENVSFRNVASDSEDDDLLLSRGRKRSLKTSGVTFWNCCLVFGCLAILSGAILLAVGFGFSTHRIDVGFQEEMQIVDKSAVEFNQKLERFKVIGLSLLAIGGFLLSVSLLLPGLIFSNDDEHPSYQTQRGEDDDGNDDDENGVEAPQSSPISGRPGSSCDTKRASRNNSHSENHTKTGSRK